MNDPPDHTAEFRRHTCCPGRDDRPEVLPGRRRVLPQRGVHVAEQDPEPLQVLPVAVVNNLRLILCRNPGQYFARPGGSQALIGALDALGHHVHDLAWPSWA